MSLGKLLGTWSGPDGETITITYDFIDGTGALSALHVDNQSSSNARVTATHLATGRTASRLCGANVITNQSVPTGAAVRLALVVNAKGKLDGVEWDIRVPA